MNNQLIKRIISILQPYTFLSNQVDDCEKEMTKDWSLNTGERSQLCTFFDAFPLLDEIEFSSVCLQGCSSIIHSITLSRSKSLAPMNLFKFYFRYLCSFIAVLGVHKYYSHLLCFQLKHGGWVRSILHINDLCCLEVGAPCSSESHSSRHWEQATGCGGSFFWNVIRKTSCKPLSTLTHHLDGTL